MIYMSTLGSMYIDRTTRLGIHGGSGFDVFMLEVGIVLEVIDVN